MALLQELTERGLPCVARTDMAESWGDAGKRGGGSGEMTKQLRVLLNPEVLGWIPRTMQ